MNRTVVDTLEQMKHVGGSWQKDLTGDKVKKVLERLEELLTADEYHEVHIARQHYLIGEGRAELDHVCNRLIQQYRHDPPERKRMTTL